MRGVRAGVVLLTFLLVATPVLAHVPSFPEDNTTPERAVDVPDAVKSWSFYDSLDAGETKYYRVTLSAGERLRVGTFTPDSGAFTPSLVVMSPSLNGSDRAPPAVRVPDGYTAVVFEGERPDRASYEPFAPSANYHTVDVDRPVTTDTTYLLAVYEPANRSGPAGVAIGYTEEFSPVEYLTVPFALARTHAWAGQHPLVAVGPFLLVLVAGAAVVRRRARGDWHRSPARVVLAAAGLLVVASGVNTLVQMVLALARTGPTPGALVTAAFVVVPLVSGGWVLRVALRRPLVLTRGVRIGLAVAGIAAALTWAGFLVGPATLLLVAALPRSVLDVVGVASPPAE